MQSRRLARRQEEVEADRVARQFLHTMTAAVQWRGAPELPWELQEGVARGKRGRGGAMAKPGWRILKGRGVGSGLGRACR